AALWQTQQPGTSRIRVGNDHADGVEIGSSEVSENCAAASAAGENAAYPLPHALLDRLCEPSPGFPHNSGNGDDDPTNGHLEYPLPHALLARVREPAPGVPHTSGNGADDPPNGHLADALRRVERAAPEPGDEARSSAERPDEMHVARQLGHDTLHGLRLVEGTSTPTTEPGRSRHAMSTVVRLRDVEPDDLPVFYAHQRDAEAARMAGFPSRDRAAFDAHWATNVLGNPSA